MSVPQKWSKALAAKQDKLFAAINKKLVKGGNLEISYHYTLLFNGFSFRGEYRLIEEIKKLNGVEDCYRAAEYGASRGRKARRETPQSSALPWAS